MQEREGFPFVFQCRRSGNCCAVPDGEVRIDAEDVARIAAHLGMTGSAFRSRYVRADGRSLVDGPGNRCVFLEDGAEASCRIYAVRPQQCRDWPFWPQLGHDRELLKKAMRLCPGIVPVGE